MNDDTTESTRNEALSALYQRVSTERCPDSVDAAVLREAATTESGRRWQPMLAMAATVVVAVLVGRELDLTGDSGPADVVAPAAGRTANEVPPAEPARQQPAGSLILDSMAPAPTAVQQQVDAAGQRAEREFDDELGAADPGRAADARAPLRESASAPRRLAAPPDPALAERLREASFADIADDACDPETAALEALTACWLAHRTAGRADEARLVRDAVERRFPEAELPAETD